MSALTVMALENADILRALRSSKFETVSDLARTLERDPSNLRRSLTRMADDGLLSLANLSPLDASLTLAAQAALEALDRADGADVAAAPAGYVALRHDQILPDPENARTSSGLSTSSIFEMADSLANQGMLQSPAVRPAADGSGYVLVMGERRWRGWGLLIEQGRWTADKTILCRLDDGDDLARLEAGLVENLQRSDLNNLEAAEGFLTLSIRHKRTAQQIAKTVGWNERTVQIALKVAKEATEADKQKYLESEATYALAKETGEAGVKRTFTWEDLRETVKTPKWRQVLDKRSRVSLLVMELAFKQLSDCDGPDGLTRISVPPGGGFWSEAEDLGLVKDMRVDQAVFAGVTDRAREWLADNQFDADPDAALKTLRIDALGSMGERLASDAGRYATDFINPPKPQPPAPEPSPEPPTQASDDRRDSFTRQVLAVDGDDAGDSHETAPTIDAAATAYGAAIEEHGASSPEAVAGLEDLRAARAANNAPSAQDPSALYAALGGKAAAPASEATSAVRDEANNPGNLEDDEFLTIAEIAHKTTFDGVDTRGGAIRGCRVFSFHTGPGAELASRLQHKRMLGFGQAASGSGFIAYLTQDAWNLIGEVDDERLEGMRHETLDTGDLTALEASGVKYVTPWLVDPAKAEEPAPSEAADSDDGSPFAEDEDDDGEEMDPHWFDAAAHLGGRWDYLLALQMTSPAPAGLDAPFYISAKSEGEGMIVGETLAGSGRFSDVRLYRRSGKLLLHWSVA
ncbi:ParB N-terminal domain-containing protein [Caulobacter sp. SL161]|uniref:ParB N-terminal domain-containing protein n=1 Tax=Caulobacter sp. SL161 TaxID=2995156 RepID=UPI0022726292|nr:ParB N-terminal domain-containing protein [Caulobacter sp. SL161]MCY1649107.1 ParB N-terminal domain-containing protein [Caulobacter sp. SL161]